MTEGFVHRWSRLKRATPVPAPELPAPPVETPPPAETIDLGEIAVWLKRNVPEAWKTAALRRLWLADPTIRDFIEVADYAWDWNTPGGAPGYGPMRAGEDMARLLARAIGTPLPPEAPPLAQEMPHEMHHEMHEGAPKEPSAAPEPPLAELPPAPEPPVETAPPPRRRGGRATPV